MVDDDPRVLETLAEILGHRYRVKTYSGGEDLRARWPGEGEAEGDAAILDIKMPKEDGLSVFHDLRRLAPKMPILFYTAYPGNEEVVERARALGPAAFLGKGCSLHDLHEFHQMKRLRLGEDLEVVGDDVSQGVGKHRMGVHRGIKISLGTQHPLLVRVVAMLRIVKTKVHEAFEGDLFMPPGKNVRHYRRREAATQSRKLRTTLKRTLLVMGT